MEYILYETLFDILDVVCYVNQMVKKESRLYEYFLPTILSYI